MKWVVIMLLLILVPLAYLYGTSKVRQPGSSAATKVKMNRVDPLVYEMISNSAKLIKGKESLESNAKPLSDDTCVKMEKWLASCDFQRFSPTEKADLVKCREMMLTILAIPTSDGFGRGYKTGQLMNEGMLPLIVDFEIDGKKATRDGHPELAQTADGTLEFVKALMLMQFKESKTATVRPSARLMVEYLAISNHMMEVKERPMWAQAALLKMQPDKLEDASERRAFTKLQDSLLTLSRAITKGNDPDLGLKQSRPLADLLKVTEVAKITDKELIDAGGKDFVSTLRAMREVLK